MLVSGLSLLVEAEADGFEGNGPLEKLGEGKRRESDYDNAGMGVETNYLLIRKLGSAGA